MSNAISLKSIHTFIAVAETGSMTKAARQLHVSHSAISQAIKSLESQLDTPLFNRVGRQVELNNIGRLYYKKVSPAFQQIIQATEAISQRRERNKVTLNMVNAMVLHWWIPRVEFFQSENPGLDVRISNITGVFDLKKERVDVALVHGSPDEWDGYFCEQLGDDDLVLVASPELLKEEPSIERLLARYPAIFVTTERRKRDWSVWCEENGLAIPKQNRNLSFSVSIQAVQATIRKLGLLVTHKHFVTDDIKHGLLQMVGPSVPNPYQGYYFVCHNDKVMNEEVNVLRQWLKTQFHPADLHQS